MKNRAELEFGQVIAAQNYALCMDRGLANREEIPKNDGRSLPPQHRAGCRVQVLLIPTGACNSRGVGRVSPWCRRREGIAVNHNAEESS